MLKGKRVTLRPVKRSDINLFLKWFNDQEVIQYLAPYLPMTEMAEEKWIESLATTRLKTDVVFIIEVKEGTSNKPIGNIGLRGIDSKDQNAWFDIVIGEKDYWSKGYGTESAQLIIEYGFQQLNLRRISSAVTEFNERSIRMHEKLGFREEGKRRKTTYVNGRFWDDLIYGLLKEEWTPMKH